MNRETWKFLGKDYLKKIKLNKEIIQYVKETTDLIESEEEYGKSYSQLELIKIEMLHLSYFVDTHIGVHDELNYHIVYEFDKLNYIPLNYLLEEIEQRYKQEIEIEKEYNKK